MPWNTNVDNVDPLINELADYLQSKGERTPQEIEQTVDWANNFAVFLQKSIRDATSQDYVAFLHQCAHSHLDEAKVPQIIDDIKAFCAASSASNSPNDLHSGRKRVNTNPAQPSNEIMALLCANDDPPTPEEEEDLNSTRLQTEGNRRRLISISENLDALQNGIFPMPSQSNDLHVNDLLDDALGGHAKSGAHSYDLNVNAFTPKRLDNRNSHPIQRDSSSQTSNLDENFSAFFTPVKRDDDFRQHFDEMDDVAHQVAENDMSEEFLAEGASPANNELLRGVSGVDYDFNQASLEIIRRGELNKLKNNKTNGVSPIDESLITTNFRPYTLDEKYLIDVPDPDPCAYKPYPQSFIHRWFIPAIPTLGGLALTTLASAFSTTVGIVVFILTLAVLVLSLSNLIPAEQQTAVAVANALFRAQKTRSYTLATTIAAIPKDAHAEIDLITLWQNVVPKWKDALLNRLKPARNLESRLVSGSDTQDSVLLLLTQNDDYWLIPLVRLNNLWYVASLEFPKHTCTAENNLTP